MLQRISRQYPKTGIHGRVVHELGKDIVRGVFLPGQRLPNENVFIDRFHGSRTAIREAFRVLSAKGLLEARQRAGTHVRLRHFWNLCDPDVLSWHDAVSISEAEIRQISELRRLFEPEAVRLFSMTRMSEQEGDELLTLLRKMERCEILGEYPEMHDLRLRFHHTIMENCGNEYLRTMHSVVRLVLDYVFTRSMQETKLPDINMRWYYLLLDKIKSSDSEAAVSAIRSLTVRDHEAILERDMHRTRVVA
ncbi:FCD domain-containing protein [Sneathiella sp. P13V-1]|uniref:FadR/GntR family transcriptional regulator n=1 Tax=Sneathiella sp. P13V-1 TaxID=2697366 RepID=UPI00187BA070|nr:FCD domain-containing protein [Sneathiella sp. P13V-1]MBE7637270.1 FCD domain-containing protein [Sneathiella sp. P13V-1]